MAEPSTLQAAEALLATLGAGRAATLRLASEYLPFSSLITVSAALADDVVRIGELQGTLDHRLDVLRGRLARPPVEKVEDDSTPRDANTIAADELRATPASPPPRLQRHMAMGTRRDAPAVPAPTPAPRPPERRGLGAARTLSPEVETPVPPPVRAVTPATPEPAPEFVAPEIEPVAAEPVPAEPVPAAPAPSPSKARLARPPAVEPEPVVEPAPAVEPEPAPAPAEAAEATPPAPLADPETEAFDPETTNPEIQLSVTREDTGEEAELGEILEDLVEDTPPAPEPAPAPAPAAAPRAVAAISVQAAGASADDEEGPALATIRPVSPLGVRAAGSDLELSAADDADDEDEDLGMGVAAPGGGIRLGGPKPRREREDLGGPRLTDDADEAPAVTQTQVPSIRPAGEDGRVAQLFEDAVAAGGRGDLHRAIQSFTDVLDLRHDRTDAYIGRGRCYLELGDYSSAMSDFQRAEDLQPDRPDPHVAMGDLYFARKEYRRAIEFYDQAVELDGSHAMARCRRGISHYYRKNYRQAFQDLQRAYSLDPEIPNIRKYVQMAVKKMERGD